MKFNPQFEIDDRPLGVGYPVYVIAEAGVSHFGDEEKAYRLVDLAAEAGADAVKFQIFDVDALISEDLPEWRTRLGSRQLPYEAFARIQSYCRDKPITFFATAHDEKSLAYLTTLDVPAYKIGSGELGNWPFLAKVGALGKPVILSTGMYTEQQVGDAMEALSKGGNRDLAILHCVTSYPVPPEEANLRAICRLREMFEAVTGYSDHTRGFHFPLAAVALGASVIEKHISLDFDVPDAQDWKVSCGPHDLEVFIGQLREIEAGLGTGTVERTNAELQSVEWATKSLVPAFNIKAGETIAAADLLSKRPGNGIAPSQIDKVVGRKAKIDLPKDRIFTWEQLA